MKEATGELNATVVVVMAIGVLMAFFYYTLWPMIKDGFESDTNCSNAICDPCLDGLGKPSTECETVNCHSKDNTKTFECVFKG